MALLSEDNLLMCQQCRIKSGQGESITVTYGTLGGGWSPRWEGRVCIHVTKEDIAEHFGLIEGSDGRWVKRPKVSA